MDLRTDYMGLNLTSPLVVSACSLSEEVDNIVQMEDAGAGAVVLFSLFEEQIRQEAAWNESILESTSGFFAEANGYFPDLEDYHVGPENYLEVIRQAKERVGIPVIASLNGITNEGWIDYARLMEQAGADGIEINVFYVPADLRHTGPEVEQIYIDILRHVKNSVGIPVAIKLNPYFSAMGDMAKRLEGAGADALVLFNRFYQPDFDIEHLKIVPSLEYSSNVEIRLPLLWISLLYGRTTASLAATTGVHGANEAIKYLLAGADVAMTASALYKNGIPFLRTMTQGLTQWMDRMQLHAVKDFKGLLSQQLIADPTAFDRANYIKILESKR